MAADVAQRDVSVATLNATLQLLVIQVFNLRNARDHFTNLNTLHLA